MLLFDPLRERDLQMTFTIAFSGRLTGHTPFASNLSSIEEALDTLNEARRLQSDVEILADASEEDLQLLQAEARAAGDFDMVACVDAALAGDSRQQRIACKAIAQGKIAALG